MVDWIRKIDDVNVVILGGGPAGLATAWFLKRQGINATILEASCSAGGMAQNSRGPETFNPVAYRSTIAHCRWFLGGFALIYDKDGEAIVPFGPPTIGGSWVEDERLLGNAVMQSASYPASQPSTGSMVPGRTLR